MASFYFSPSYIWSRIRRLSSFSEFIYYLRGGLLFIRDLVRISLFSVVKFGRDRGVAEPLGNDTARKVASITAAGKTDKGVYDGKILVREMFKARKKASKNLLVDTTSSTDMLTKNARVQD